MTPTNKSAPLAWVVPGIGTLPALGGSFGVPGEKPKSSLTVKRAANSARRRVKQHRRRPPPANQLLSVDQAADYLGISPGTLRNWLSLKRLEYVKVGRLTKLTKAALDRYIASRTVPAVADRGQRS